ncbi:MAG: hypothetical protein HRJ53_01520 [Acidobacteria bacterium Pan2503]|uniref:Uncharacterized protein n=1 Tax=Candidatus Acidiferrum panamense TaxID=2741543 RepID=A0A7V8SV85_9BACT|nr:hypothetical protein [Candidatus Acidoferrum panamensis]
MKAAGRRKVGEPELKLEPFNGSKAYGTLWFGENIVGVLTPKDLVDVARIANVSDERVKELTTAVLGYYAAGIKAVTK